MAGSSNDVRSLGQFSNNRIAIAIQVLKDLADDEITKPSAPFLDTRSNSRGISNDEIVNQWIRFGMPAIVVYSAYFANTRWNTDATSEALELAYKVLQRSSAEEKQCTGLEFIAKGAKFVKVFASKCPFTSRTVGLMMDKEIFDRLDELWIVLRNGHYPEPFNERRTAAASEEMIKNMKQRFRGTPSFSTEPSATSWLPLTRTPEYFKAMAELSKVHPRSLSANDDFMMIMRQMVDNHMRQLGHALRYHNEHNPNDQIILQDVMEDIVNFETNCPKGRSAAQNHLLCLITLGTTIERHKTSTRGDSDLVKVQSWSSIHESILKIFDVP